MDIVEDLTVGDISLGEYSGASQGSSKFTTATISDGGARINPPAPNLILPKYLTTHLPSWKEANFCSMRWNREVPPETSSNFTQG